MLTPSAPIISRFDAPARISMPRRVRMTRHIKKRRNRKRHHDDRELVGGVIDARQDLHRRVEPRRQRQRLMPPAPQISRTSSSKNRMSPKVAST